MDASILLLLQSSTNTINAGISIQNKWCGVILKPHNGSTFAYIFQLLKVLTVGQDPKLKVDIYLFGFSLIMHCSLANLLQRYGYFCEVFDKLSIEAHES